MKANSIQITHHMENCQPTFKDLFERKKQYTFPKLHFFATQNNLLLYARLPIPFSHILNVFLEYAYYNSSFVWTHRDSTGI